MTAVSSSLSLGPICEHKNPLWLFSPPVRGVFGEQGRIGADGGGDAGRSFGVGAVFGARHLLPGALGG